MFCDLLMKILIEINEKTTYDYSHKTHRRIFEKLSSIKDVTNLFARCTKNQFLKNKDANYILPNQNKSKIILIKTL